MTPRRILLPVFVLFAIGVLLSHHTLAPRAETLPQSEAAVPDEGRPVPKCSPIAPRQLEFAYYTLRDGFNSTLFLVSGSPTPLEFVMAIHSRSGQTLLAPSMTIQPQEKLSIDMATFLTKLSADVTGDFSEGSVSIYFNGTIMPLAGQLTMTNPAKSLVLESEMVDNSPALNLLPPMLHALWWSLGGGRVATIAVSNASDRTVTADVFLDFLGERHESAALTFAPHETKVLSITQLLGDLKVSPAQAPEGGITIIPRGPTPSLIAQGKITDPITGFSTNLNFMDPALQLASALHATGVPIGLPSKDSPFAGTGVFTPHVVLRNLTGSPQTATITLEYPVAASSPASLAAASSPPDSSDQEAAASAPPAEETRTEQRPLTPLTLGPYATVDLALDSVMGTLPLPLPYCAIRIQYSGAPGTVIGEVASVEQRGDLVIDSRLANEGNGWAGSGGNPWHLDDETESIQFLTNMGDRDVRIGYIVSAGGVNYYLTDLTLKPRETRAIDVRKLRDAQEEDFQGTKIPAGATDGSILWNRIEHVPVMGQLVMLKRNKGMASPYSCFMCNCGLSYSYLIVAPCFALKPGQTGQEVATGLYVNCSGTPYYNIRTNSASWSSSNPSVATVNNTTPKGLVTAVSSGTALAIANFCDNVVSDESYGYGYCVYYPLCVGAGATVKVYTFTVNILPSTVAPTGAGTPNTTTVTVQTNPPVSGKTVTLQDVRLANTGGHLNHPLPHANVTGTFNPSSGTTDAQGRFQSTYTVKEFAGEYQIKATIEGTTVTGPITLQVMVPGLQQLTDGANFNLVGSTPYHVLPDNHYGTSTANSKLVAIANDYASSYPGSILEYNDQSLPWGGLFDIGPGPSCPSCVLWYTPHNSHRLGTNCDVRMSTVPLERREDLEEIFSDYGIAAPEGTHWHLTL